MQKESTKIEKSREWHKDQRHQLFLAFYKDPTSQTFANAKQSAIRAGFSESYADNIMALLPDWLSEVIGQMSPLLIKAEQNIKEFLELPNETQAMGAFGPIFQTIKKKVQDGTYKNGNPKFKTIKEKVPVYTLNTKVMKIKQDSSHFIAETVGKLKYSKKDTGEGPVQNNIFIFANEQRSKIAQRIIRGGSISDTASKRKSD